MKLSDLTPPNGTIRDWLSNRAELGGTAFVFPEDGTTLDWVNLRTEALRYARQLTNLGAEKSAKESFCKGMHASSD